MGTCFTCGNEYQKTFSVTTHAGTQYEFDCLECAIQELAPMCTHCGCRVIGHGIERNHDIYCCENCARHNSLTVNQSTDHFDPEKGSETLPDSIPHPPTIINRRHASSVVDQKP